MHLKQIHTEFQHPEAAFITFIEFIATGGLRIAILAGLDEEGSGLGDFIRIGDFIGIGKDFMGDATIFFGVLDGGDPRKALLRRNDFRIGESTKVDASDIGVDDIAEITTILT